VVCLFITHLWRSQLAHWHIARLAHYFIISFCFKAISVSQAGDDPLAIYADLFTQTGDVDIDRTVEYVYFIAPYAGKDVLARKYPSFVL
jgi:hypothetical protein